MFFFIFAGNMARIDGVKNLFSTLLEKNTLLVSVLSCQFISNVPSAILLSQFTENYRELLISVNIGGVGTLISSLASLITFREYTNHNSKGTLSYVGIVPYNYLISSICNLRKDAFYELPYCPPFPLCYWRRPLWWNNKLWFVDGFCNAVRTADPQTGEEKEYISQGVVTSLNPMADGKLLLTRLEGCFEVLDPATGEITPFLFDHQNQVLHFNDSKVGPDGCLYVGNRRDHPHKKGEVNPDNGLYRLSPDGKILYVVSGQMALRKFVFGETLTEVNPIYLEGHPDGMTIDTEGYPICALWAPGKVVRVNPETVRTLETYQMPCCVSSCAFGGKDFSKLYVVTNAWSSDPIEMQDGRTYEVETGRHGNAPYIFGIPKQTR